MRRRLKRVDRLAYELCGIAELAHDGQLVRLDARDVHEITDDPAHLATEPLDAVRIADDLRDRRVRRRELVHEVGALRAPARRPSRLWPGRRSRLVIFDRAMGNRGGWTDLRAGRYEEPCQRGNGVALA